MQEVTVLGFQRDTKEVWPSMEMLAAIRDEPIPTGEKELMSFIYTLHFLRAFVPGLYDLTRFSQSMQRV